MTTYVDASNLDEACRLLGDDEDEAKLISGGTALVLMMRFGFLEPSTLVSIRRIEGLEGIRAEGDGVWIGARTTLTEIAGSPVVQAAAASLAYACGRVGNTRVRNVATIGGNLAEADYASDPPSVLAGLDATCTAYGPAGTREVAVRELITDFYTTALEPDEIITGVTIPSAGASTRRTAYEKFVSRSSEDRPCVGVAVRADYDAGVVSALSVVVGAVARVPQRFDEITAGAVGGRLAADEREAIARAYSEAIDPMDDARGSAWYRRRMIAVLVRRALERVSQS